MPGLEGTASNPYDFRSPVRRRRLLAGRENELDQIDEFLRGAAVGKPSHFSLFGPPGMGKSSLLNGVTQVARERNLLPVKVELREATVESGLAFYAAVFEAALDALIQIGALDASDSLMRGWARQTLAGDLDVSPDDQPLEIGLLVAAKMNGKVVAEVPAPVLQRDIATVVNLGSRSNIRGVVLCLDSAETLDDNDDLAPSLMELANATPTLTLVTAAESSGKLQAAASRAWTQIEVGPFEGPRAVFEAITRPLEDVEESRLAPEPPMAVEIHMLTGGQPYEVNLVCHFIWEAIREGEQSEFALSETVIERVLQELESKGRHEASPTISNVTNLTTSDFELIAGLAPYEGLTVRQLALVRLMLEDYGDDRLSEVEDEISEELYRLQSLGVVRVERDRFELHGGPDTRIYLKYAAERRAGQKIRYGDTYARQATACCRRALSEVLLGPDNLDALLVGRWRRREVGDLVAGRVLNRGADSVQQRNVSALAEMLPGFYDDENLASFAEKGGILFGFLLRVGLHDVEYTDIAINVNELEASDCLDRVRGWFDEREELLAKYQISVQDSRCELLDPALSKAVAAYSELDWACRMTLFVYRAGLVDDAIALLADVVRKCEALIGSEPSDPLVRGMLADAHNRLGFMQATLEKWEKASASLERSRALSLEEEWLTIFNLAYVHASSGDFRRAEGLAREAAAQLAHTDGRVFLHAWVPAPDDWSSDVPRANVVVVKGGWIERFIELQTLVYATKADGQAFDALRDVLDGLSLSSPPALLRLAGWCELTLLGRPERALDLFDRAANATHLEDMDAVSAELEYVRALIQST